MKILLIFLTFSCCISVHAQDVSMLLKEASNFEKQLNEPEALKKYTAAANLDKHNITAFVKCTEINCAIGARQKDKTSKANYYNFARTYATQALTADSMSADANYAMALTAAKLTEVTDENKQVVALVRESKIYVDKAVAINPNHAKANYTLGKWHFEMVTLNWAKKAAAKTIYGGLSKGDIDSAIYYMEKCKTLEPYFAQNYLDLAKAYQFNNRPARALEVLNKLVRLPIRTPDDTSIKAEGKKMLDAML